ncbi:MAG: cyclic nucleotide-binding domain-containing protein [Gammaproteobacteria bacterium]|nr:cyclic nucleotide-binding domain-containing protein [Gammaproteobacteria bacterium]
MNLIEYLQSVPLFSEMSNEELKVLEKVMVIKDYSDSHPFVYEEKNTDKFYIILEGEVEISHEKGTEPGTQRISTMGPGSLIGLHSLIGHYRPIVSCHGMGNVKVAYLPSSAFNLLYNFDTHLPHHFQMVVARQLATDYRNIVNELREMMLADSTVE